MGGGSTTTDYSSLPVYGDQADLDYAVRKGQIGMGDRARVGNSIYEYDREAGWNIIRTMPPGTFADPATGTTPGILNPLPTVNDGILNPSPTGGITDPNYKSLGEYLVGPTYTGPTTADEYVMQRAGGPAWDYSYPMYLGAGGYGPGNTIPTVDSTGDWITDTITDTTTDTTSDTTTDDTTTTTTTTTDDDDTIIAEGPDVRDGRVGTDYGWGTDQTPPSFPNTWPGIFNYNERVDDMGPVEAFGLLDGLQRTGQGLGGFVDPSAPYASPLSPENFNPLSLGGAGDPGWAPESTIQQEVWGESGVHSTFDPSTGKMVQVQHHQGQPKGSSFLGMIGNAFAKTEGSKPSESIAAMVDALTPQQQQMQEVTGTGPTGSSAQAQKTLDALRPAAQSIFSPPMSENLAPQHLQDKGYSVKHSVGPSQHDINVQAVQAQVAASNAAAQAIRDQQASAAQIMAKYAGRREPAENYMSAEEAKQVKAAERAARGGMDALGGGGGFLTGTEDPTTGYGGGLWT